MSRVALPVSDPDVLAAASGYLGARARLTDLCIEIQQIAAPTGDETARAAWVADALRQRGLTDVVVDKLPNVYGRLPGRSTAEPQPALLVSAHTDTVFPHGTDLSARFDPVLDRLYGPGIGDNAAGVAALVALVEGLRPLALPTDIWLVANCAEEGLGDLRGMRAALDRLGHDVGAAVVIEGMGLGRIVHRGLGSQRFRVDVSAPGGHSWSDFGAASAIHVLAMLAADLARLRVPTQPRTTFNIGRVWGGTSINTIAQSAGLEIDLRSEEPGALRDLVEQFKGHVGRYGTARWARYGVHIDVKPIGDRPSGAIDAEHPLVRAAAEALASAGLMMTPDLRISSTDANIPLSRGIPAVCVGVTDGGNAHRLEEWISTAQLPQGMQHLLLLVWSAAAWLAGGQH